MASSCFWTTAGMCHTLNNPASCLRRSTGSSPRRIQNEARVMSDFCIHKQHLSTLEMDGKPCAVSVRIAYDRIEYIGRLFFADPETGEGIPDHGAIPCRTVEESVDMARPLNIEDRPRRYHRARADKRRYTSLRRAT